MLDTTPNIATQYRIEEVLEVLLRFLKAFRGNKIYADVKT